MARRKRTDFQREYDLLTIAERYRDGVLQSEIAAELGLSQGQISQDLALIMRRRHAATLETVEEALQAEISKLNGLENEYRRAWELSLQHATGVTIETKTVGGQADSDGSGATESPVIETKTVKRRARHFGSSAYLDGIKSCIIERSKLKGLYPATKQQNFNVDLSTLTDEQLDRLEAGESIEQVMRRGQPAA